MLLSLLAGGMLYAQPDTLGWRLERFKYPFKIHFITTTVESKAVEMFYMDQKPTNWNGKTIVLLHGKNFPAAYWGNAITAFTAQGYRVIAPDQVGFGKSSKPEISYSFELLAGLTHQLLDTLGVKQAAIVGHSTGGMLAVRFALLYPGMVTKLVLADALGLEDWHDKGVPTRTVDQWYEEEKTVTYEQVVDYHRNYYAEWDEKYRVWADVQYGMMKGKHAEQSAKVSALIYDMIFTQPVVHEFKNIKTPTLIIVGSDDHTKLAKGASERVTNRLGNYHKLGRKAHKAIHGSQLIEYEKCGHLPFFEKEDVFYADVARFIAQ